MKGSAKGSKKRANLAAGASGNRIRVKLRPGKYRVKFQASLANGSCRSAASSSAKRLVVKRGKRARVAVKYTSQLATPSPYATQAAKVLSLTNQARSRSQVCGTTAYPAAGRLAASSRLQSVAQAHSQDMATNNYFDHTNQQGQSPFDRMAAAGYSYWAAGENIAAGQPTPAAVVQAWLDSPGHCRNIMSADYTELGVGVATGGRYGIYWTQNFGTPR
ncbi:MAG: CAP domain-containing protein [Actinobacteria bacterium]|nr:CAP domain-containing protein [Actinomycetota bacterium]